MDMADLASIKIKPKNMTYRYTLIDDAEACLMHDGVQLLPGLTSVSGSVDRSLLGLDEDDLTGITAPHDVKQWTVDLEYLEADFVLIHCIYYINHISCTSVCKQAESCQ